MKKNKVIPLEEIAFAKYMGELSDEFKLVNSRLSYAVRHSNMFRGFRDGYFDLSHKYETMPEWKQKIIAMFVCGDELTAYDLSYVWGKSCRNNQCLTEHTLVEVASV